MELQVAITSRRSVRSFKAQVIPDAIVDAIIEAGCEAPIASAKYEKVCITVIQDAVILNKIKDAAAEYFSIDRNPLYNAPLLILVSGKKYPPIGFGNQTWSQDHIEIANAACIIQNMTLTATAHGLGSTFLTGFIAAFTQSPELLKEIDLKKGFVPLAGLVVGYQSRETKKMGKEKNILIKKL